MTSTATAADLALVAGCSLRLTRVITTDTAGRPVRLLAARDPLMAEGVECPFCVGYWVGLGVLASWAAVRSRPRLLALWRLGAGSLALNYAVGHVSARLD